MKKVVWALVLAGLIISGILVYLLVSGVRLQERRIVKWSSVETPQLAGHKISRFMFPVIQQKNRVVVTGDNSFSKSFYPEFKKESLKNDAKARVTFQAKSFDTIKDLELGVMPLDETDYRDECRRGSQLSCLAQKALNQFNKKPRQSGLWWINMYRVSENKMVLFYKTTDEGVR